MKVIFKKNLLPLLLIAFALLGRANVNTTRAANLPAGINVQAGGLAISAQSTQKLSTPELIEHSFARGEITTAERALYLAYALYEPKSLPVRFQSNVGWYGTHYVSAVQSALQSVNSSSLDAVQQELGRMDTLASTVCEKEDGANSFESASFHFNYGTILGGLAINDYVTSMEKTFDIEVTQFGWAKPPFCSGGDTCEGNTNPWGKFPIQLSPLGNALYGYVTTGGAPYTGWVGDNPNTPAVETESVASCMVLNDDFSQFAPDTTQGALDSTTSHEFVHAIQNGYGDPGGVEEDAMWYESPAAYMEDEIFDDANSDYQYLWPSINSCLGEWPDADKYANFLFFRHVAEHNGGTNVAGGGENVMQHAWENIGAGQDGLVAYGNALVTAGTNLPDAFHKYAIAAKFSKACGSGYDAPYCFEEGADYAAFVGNIPEVQGSIATNPGSFTGSILNHYAGNWISLPTTGSPYQVTLKNTADGGQLRGSLVCDTGSEFVVTPFTTVVSAGNATSIGSFSAAGCESVVAVITNQEQISGNPKSCTADSYTLSVASPVLVPTATATRTPTPIPTNTPVPTAVNTPQPKTSMIYLPIISK